MAQDVKIANITYSDVPAIEIPKATTGTALFTDTSPTTAVASDVASGKYFFTASGQLTLGSASGGTAAISVVDTTDTAGGTIRTITALDISDTTAVASDVASGKYFYTADGTKTAGTASGGGGEFAWLGDDAEKVDTVINRVINLKDDTSYDDWTASTTAAAIIPAETNASYTLSANLSDYDYCFVTRGYIEPVYVNETPTTYRTYRVCQYHVQGYYGYPNSNHIDQIQSESAGNIDTFVTGTGLFYQYYYNSSGILTARSATQCGPLYMSSYPTYSASSLSDGVSQITLKFPAFNAKCDTSRFTTARKEQVDSANTNYYLTVDLYRVPHGNSVMSHWVSAACADLNAT